MAQITVSRDARKDLESIHVCICDDFCNPSAAHRIISGNEQDILIICILHQRQD